REAGLIIRFVPQTLVASAGTCTFRELIEFSNRQIKITRVCMPHLWISAFIGSAIFVGTISASVLYIAFGPQPQRIISSAVMLTVVLLSVAKAWLRLKAVAIAIPQAKRQAFAQLTLWFPAQFLFLANCVAALFSRRITWRGIEYRLIAHDRTEILANRE